MNRRKAVLALLAAGAAPLVPGADRLAKSARIGFLGASSARTFERLIDAFRSGLRDLGYVEGESIQVEFRWANGKYERLHQLAVELLHANVAVLVTHGTPAIRAAKRATATTPIVMVTSGDAVAQGLVADIARPGGNVTGMTIFAPELAVKRLELLREAFPRIKRTALLINPDNPVKDELLKAARSAVKALEIEIREFAVREAGELEGAFAAMVAERVEAVGLTEEAVQISNMQQIAALAAKRRLLSIGYADFAERGGLMAYGANLPSMFRRAAYFVDKILRGASPADIPVERPTDFEMSVNLAVAKALGTAIPQPILLRADRVIQ